MAKNKGGAGNRDFFVHTLSQAFVPPLNIITSARTKFPSPRTLPLEKLREARRGLSKRSRDLSHAFEGSSNSSMGRYSQSQCDHLSDRFLTLDQAAAGILHPEKQTPKRSISQVRRPAIEQHLISIYGNAEIMRNPRLLEEETERLRKSISHTCVNPRIVMEYNNPMSDRATRRPQKSVFFPEEESPIRVPPSTLGVPSNRRQAEMLTEWLKATIENVDADEGLSEDEAVERLLTANRFALLEVNRQVSVQCVERGNLMKQIVDNYMSLGSRYSDTSLSTLESRKYWRRPSRN